jgi:hypothetical protein
MELTVLEHNQQRVLTTTQLAEAYGADRQQISKNFVRNVNRYTQGKHYFALSGEEKRNFLNHVQIDDGLKNAQIIYLWTEKGAWLHAKSLNTDEAWAAYELLVDEYYRIQTQPFKQQVPMSPLEMIHTITAEMMAHNQRLEQVERKVDEQITLQTGEQRRLQKAINIRVYRTTTDDKLRKQYFRDLHREIRDRFAVASYRDVKRKDLQAAIAYVDNWVPRREEVIC